MFGTKDTLACLEMGAVETLIVWENLEIQRYVFTNTTSGGCRRPRCAGRDRCALRARRLMAAARACGTCARLRRQAAPPADPALAPPALAACSCCF